MMLWKGALGFKLFTGEDMPIEEMKKLCLAYRNNYNIDIYTHTVIFIIYWYYFMSNFRSVYKY